MPDLQAIQAEVDKIYGELQEQPPHTAAQVDACKALIKLYLLVFEYHMYDEGRKLLTKDYIQHNLSIGTGRESIMEFAENHRNPDGSTRIKMSYKRILVDGDYIILHMQGNLGKVTNKVIDIFRYRDGKFLEHWDVEQLIPPRAEWGNPNGPF